MPDSGFGVIILAAGYSSRMGFFKPVLKLNGITLTQRLIQLYLNSGIDVYLVTGWQRSVLMESVSDLKVNIVDNPDFAEGMFSSVKCGLRAAIKANYRAIFVQPVDIPLVRTATLKSLCGAAERTDCAVLYPCYHSRRGHPAVVFAGLIPFILDWQGEGGLKACLANRDSLAQNIEVEDSNILFDVDTPGDLPELAERYRQLILTDDLQTEIRHRPAEAL
ncbi:MAG TPA: nucleotidyltransferase family protein [Dehalococcoidales bacterium]|nr:nucleotidyltransferase family protein [Dehalococcoidales bacterium]